MTQEKEQLQGTLTKQRRTSFVMSPHHLFCNNNYTSKAKSLWVVLESKPEGWKFFWSEILKHFKEGRDQIKNAMKELEKGGYIQKKRAKKGNIYCGMDIQVFYDPLLPFDPFNQENQGSPRVTEFQSPGIQSPETQLTENRSSENQAVYKETSKQYLSKKDLSKKPKTIFTIPTDEELKLFFESFCSDWEEFRDHFNSNGWKIGGKTPMVDWQAAARNWEKRHKKFNPDARTKNQSNTNSLNKNIEMVRLLLKREMNFTDYYKYFAGNEIKEVDGKYLMHCSENIKNEHRKILNKLNIELQFNN